MALNYEEEKEEKEVKAKRKTKKTRELLEEANNHLQDLENQLKEYEGELKEIEKKMDELGDFDAKNLKVSHGKYGKGKVSKQDGKYIDVKFGSVVKKFVLPGAIADEYLEVDDEKTLEYFKKSNDIHKQMLGVQLHMRSTEFAIERQKDNIEKINQKA